MTLTHGQAINRLHDLRMQMTAIAAELDAVSDEDDEYFHELVTEFFRVDRHRRRLERDAALASVREITDRLSAAGYPSAGYPSVKDVEPPPRPDDHGHG